MQNSRRTCSVLLLAVIALTGAVLWPVIDATFLTIRDDALYVTNNSAVLQGIGLEGLQWAFSTPYAGHWHPLTWLSHMLDVSLFGLNPMGHHAMSLLLHLANTALLYFALQALTGAPFRSLLVAMLFALHPLHVQPVAWIAGRKELLAAFFGHACLWCYALYVRDKARKWWVATFFTFVLGMLSKSILITWPFLFLLLDYWPLRRLRAQNIRSLLVEKIPFFLVSACFGIAAFKAQDAAGALQTLHRLPVASRIENAVLSYLGYLEKMLVPMDVAVFYPYPRTTELNEVFVAGGILLGISVFALLLLKRAPYVFVGWFWYIGTLLPVIGLVQAGMQSMADRYTYITLTGVFVLLVWGAKEVMEKTRIRKRVALGVLSLFLVFFAWQSNIQAKAWNNPMSLMLHALRVTKDNYFAYVYIGQELRKRKYFKEAEALLKAALEYEESRAAALVNLGHISLDKGDLDQALEYYERVNSETLQELGALHNQVSVLLMLNREQEALELLSRPDVLAQGNAHTFILRGELLESLGQPDAAGKAYKRSLELDPQAQESKKRLHELAVEKAD